MVKLSALPCEVCDANAKLLTENEIPNLLLQLDGWELVVESGIQMLKCEFNTTNYSRSMAFTNAIAEMAESVNHHPLLVVEYSSVGVAWWSHKIKGLHRNDFIMAAKTSEIFNHQFA